MEKEKYKLYKGEIELSFDPVKHIYEANGKLVYGVTGIIGVLSKPFLTPWAVKLTADYVRENKGFLTEHLEDILVNAKREHRRVSKEARELGTRVHDIADRWFSENKSKLMIEMLGVKNEEERNALISFIKITEKMKLEREFGERKIYSKKYHYAGTTDFIGKVDGVMTLVDYKCSSAIYPEVFLQLFAYAQAIEEETGLKIEQTAVFRLGKDGEPEVKIDKNWKEKLPAFLACKAIYEWRQSLKGKEFNKGQKEAIKKVIKK